MREVDQEVLDTITGSKEVGARATFRKTLPVFEVKNLTDSLGLADPAWIDACTYGTGILRVTSVANVLYTQYVPDIHGDWPAWTNTGIALYAGSRPAVENENIWYQRANSSICYRHYSWPSDQVLRNMPGAMALAPVAGRCYGLWQRHAGSYELVSLSFGDSSQYAIYGPTSLPRVDAVSFDGKEYFYTMDRDPGRIIEIKHAGNSSGGKDSYGVGKAVIPIDAIDDVYGFSLGYASVVDEKVVVTGRMRRTSDDVHVDFDAYAAGPEFFSFGREAYIGSGLDVRGKLLRVGDYFVASGATRAYIAKATTVFGGSSHPDLELTTSDLSSFKLTEAEGRSSTLEMELSTDLSHTAVAPGSEVEISMAYNNNFTRLATCHVQSDAQAEDEQGRSRVVSGVGKTSKRLAAWSPEQGVYIPSQAKSFDFAGQLTKVIRATGQWEKASPEDEDSALKLRDLNKLGVLYSTARASRGGAMRGEFYYPSYSYFSPYYGVAINYYRESAAEAAGRLGVEVNDLDDDMYGHNGIVAIYSPTQHNNAEGIALYIWKDSVLTKLTSVQFTIPADTWHWLQIEFIEGEIRVKYRLTNSAAWTDLITYMYNQSSLPWKSDTFGRGAIIAKNIVPTQAYYGLSATDMTLAVDSNSGLPASGTLLIDDEQIAYSGKSTASYPTWGGSPGNGNAFILYWPIAKLTTTGWTGHFLPIDGGIDTGLTNNSFNGLAFIIRKGTARLDAPAIDPPNKTFRVTGYAQMWPVYNVNLWQGDTQKAGWTRQVGTGTGAWALQGHGLFLNEDVSKYIFPGEEPVMPASGWPFYSIWDGAFKRAYYLTERGANDTVATSHSAGTAHWYTTHSVQIGRVGCFTQDEDQQMEDGLKTIVRMAGGEMTCKALTPGDYEFTSGDCVKNVVNDHKNLIATMDLPVLTDGTSAGICFRGSSGFYSSGFNVSSAGVGYSVTVSRTGTSYYLDLRLVPSNGLVERVPIRPTNTNGAATANVPAGTLKVSVQDSLFSVWLNGRYLHTFWHEAYSTGNHMAFYAGLACYVPVHLSELDDLLADIVVGVRGNGMSVLSELIADRRILWREDPDGSLYFYKNRSYALDLPDLISAVSTSTTDDVVSRVRAEGLQISEVLDSTLIKNYGNTFVTINARHANDVGESRAEARFTISASACNSQAKRYAMVPHPALQPGDIIGVPEGNTVNYVSIRGQSIVVGFVGNTFACDAQLDVMMYDGEV